jgi:hypothetical protein
MCLQIPFKVSLPLFEVDLSLVREGLIKRLESIKNYLFGRFEKNLVSSSQAICARYREIALYLDRELKNAKEILEMDMYKNNLILEMTSLRDRIHANRQIIFFLVRNDRLLDDSILDLIHSLHDWPFKLAALVDKAEERHKMDRNRIETMLVLRKEQFEEEI